MTTAERPVKDVDVLFMPGASLAACESVWRTLVNYYGDPKVTFIGEYFGFAGSERGFHPGWTDTRPGIQELWTDTLSGERHEDDDDEDEDD